jgi:hypothetical protein
MMVAVGFIPRFGRSEGARRGATPEFGRQLQASLRDANALGGPIRGLKATATIARSLRDLLARSPKMWVMTRAKARAPGDTDNFGMHGARLGESIALQRDNIGEPPVLRLAKQIPAERSLPLVGRVVESAHFCEPLKALRNNDQRIQVRRSALTPCRPLC